uniref:General transcription factor IIF subunit 2 n=1 Tax=Rhabditophanes sp. KR3021 TaxID=114890 RepID=A0AC35TI71_9BILA
MSKRSNVDTTDANKGLWLVKVPRYLSDIWKKNQGQKVGTFDAWEDGNGVRQCRVMNLAQFKREMDEEKPETVSVNAMNLIQTQEVLKPTDVQYIPINRSKSTRLFNADEIPVEHKFSIRKITDQTMFVLNEDKSHLEENKNLMSGKLAIQGRCLSRAEIVPPETAKYMKMKIAQIRSSANPMRSSIKLDSHILKVARPVARQQEQILREKAKKSQGKTYRMEKDELQNEIFKCFEQHQYFYQKDLAKKLDQPGNFVGEVLNEIGIFNSQPPHKGMWELKPEYRSNY